AWFLLYPIVSFPLAHRSLRVLEMNWRTVILSLKAPFVSTAIMSILIVFGSLSLMRATVPMVRLPLTVVSGAIVYAGVMLLVFPERLKAMIRILKVRRLASEPAGI